MYVGTQRTKVDKIHIDCTQNNDIWFMLGNCREYFIRCVSHISQGPKLFINEFLELGLVY